MFAEYLEARALADATSKNPLITVIRQTSETLLTKDDTNTEETWGRYVKALSQAATANIERHILPRIPDTDGGSKCCKTAEAQDILAAAAYLGHSSTVKDLIEKSSDIMKPSEYFGSPIHMAAAGGHEHILITLLNHAYRILLEIPVNFRDPSFERMGFKIRREIEGALYRASLAGHSHVVESLLTMNQSATVINRSDFNYSTGLAASGGHSRTVQILLDESRPDERMLRNEEVLREASKAGHLDIVRMMLDLGTNVNARLYMHQGALNLAAARGHLKVLRLLLARGAEQVIINHRKTPLCEAIQRGFIKATQILIDHGADLNAGWPAPLVLAAEYGHAHITQLLIDKGVDVRLKDNGPSALWTAAAKGYESVIDVLLAAGLDINGSGDCDSPLLWAIMRSQDHAARYLVKLGALRVEPGKSAWARRCAADFADFNLADQKSYGTTYDENMSSWQRLDESLFSADGRCS